jgi:hypothetical protein
MVVYTGKILISKTRESQLSQKIGFSEEEFPSFKNMSKTYLLAKTVIFSWETDKVSLFS